ncbi:UNVERIFIED_CONTAM: hypothetical protein GTU68_008349 [Idotea baltica]|nr:hypothetical protein [Idotea baltica]
MVPYFYEKHGNAASRSHPFGWEAEEAVDYAREQVANLINVESKEVIFTSGATEADNLALKGVFEMYSRKGNHIITLKTEHKAVLDSCQRIEKEGGQVTYLDVEDDGRVDLAKLEAAITDKTILISIMWANNETGVIQPMKEIGAICAKHGILFMSDATQAVGKVPVDPKEIGIHLMAFSAHKMYGPKGVGALFVNRKQPRVKVTAQMDGGGHVEGEGLMMTFNQTIGLSSGSACTSASLEPSYVLIAMGLGDDLAHSSLRFSLGRFTTEEEIDYTIEAIANGVNHMRDLSPIWEMYKEGVDLESVEWSEH